MSKRFGRNQKRAMRLQIQSQAELIERGENKINSLNAGLYQSNEIINRTASILGQHFASLPVETMEVKEMQWRYKYSIPRQINYSDRSFNPVVDFVDSALGFIEIYQSDLYVDDLRHSIHMRYKSLSGDVAYGLSEEAWRSLSEDQLIGLIKEQIAHDMARLLVRERKKAVR